MEIERGKGYEDFKSLVEIDKKDIIEIHENSNNSFGRGFGTGNRPNSFALSRFGVQGEPKSWGVSDIPIEIPEQTKRDSGFSSSASLAIQQIPLEQSFNFGHQFN